MAVATRRRSLDPPRRGARRGPHRRRRGLRFLVLASVAVLLVTAVRSILRGSNEAGPDPRLAYVDQVRPHVDASTRQGAALADLRRSGRDLGPDGLRRSLTRLVESTAATYEAASAVGPPDELDAARGLLLATLKARQMGVSRFADALGTELGPGTPTEPVIEAVVAAGSDLLVADRAYLLFVNSLPEAVRGAAPASTWVGEGDDWDRPAVSAFIASLRASASVAPIHDVGVVTVVSDPAPVGRDGEAEVLAQTDQLRLSVVVANLGNAPERQVAVEAVATSVGGMNVARQFVDLEPGQRRTVELRLRLAPGNPTTVTVKAVPVAGEANLSDNEVQPPLQYVRR